MAAVANFGAPADVDARNGVCVSRLLRRPLRDGQSEIPGRCIRHSWRCRNRDAIELDVEFGPCQSGPGRAGYDTVTWTPAGSQPAPRS